MYIVAMFDCRRGREGLVDLKKNTWEKRFNEFHQVHYFQKVTGELSKNHRNDKVRNDGYWMGMQDVALEVETCASLSFATLYLPLGSPIKL